MRSRRSLWSWQSRHLSFDRSFVPPTWQSLHWSWLSSAAWRLATAAPASSRRSRRRRARRAPNASTNASTQSRIASDPTRHAPTHPRCGPPRRPVSSTVNGTWTFFHECSSSCAFGATTCRRVMTIMRAARRAISLRVLRSTPSCLSRPRRASVRGNRAEVLRRSARTARETTLGDIAIRCACARCSASSRSISAIGTGMRGRAHLERTLVIELLELDADSRAPAPACRDSGRGSPTRRRSPCSRTRADTHVSSLSAECSSDEHRADGAGHQVEVEPHRVRREPPEHLDAAEDRIDRRDDHQARADQAAATRDMPGAGAVARPSRGSRRRARSAYSRQRLERLNWYDIVGA